MTNVGPDFADARPTIVRYRVMAFVLVLSFLTYFDRQCIVWVKPEIQKDLSISDESMGLVLGAFWLAYSLFDIPAGWLGDRFGARLALTRVVLAWSLFTVLTGFAAAGLIGVIWGGAFYAWFRNDPIEKASVNAAELALIREGATPGDGPGHGPIELGMWRALLSNRSLWALAALYFFGSFGWS